MKANEHFAKVLQGAKEVLQALEHQGKLPTPPLWIPEELNEDIDVALMLSKKLLFVSESDFQQEHGHKLPDDIPRVQLRDEQNQILTGFAVEHPDHKHRTLELVTTKRLNLHRQLASSMDELRSGQNLDLLDTVQNLKAKKLRLQPLTAKQLADLEARVKRASSSEATELATPAEEAPLRAAEAAAETQEEEEAETHQAKTTAQMLLDDSPEKSGKAGGRGQGRGSKRGGSAALRGGRGGSASKQAKTGTDDASVAGGASAWSSRSRVNTKFGSPKSRKSSATTKGGKDPKAKLMDRASEVMEDLNCREALSGALVGQKKYQAQRVLTGLEEKKQENTSQYITLRAHLERWLRCVKYSDVVALQGLDAAEREEFYQDIGSTEEIPCNFKLNALTVALRSLQLTSASAVDEWLSLVQPFHDADADSGLAFVGEADAKPKRPLAFPEAPAYAVYGGEAQPPPM